MPVTPSRNFLGDFQAISRASANTDTQKRLRSGCANASLSLALANLLEHHHGVCAGIQVCSLVHVCFQCSTCPRDSGVCVTTAARRCAEETSGCSASISPPSRGAWTHARSSGRSGSVYLRGKRGWGQTPSRGRNNKKVRAGFGGRRS